MKKLLIFLSILVVIFIVNTEVKAISYEDNNFHAAIDGDLSLEEGGTFYEPTEEDLVNKIIRDKEIQQYFDDPEYARALEQSEIVERNRNLYSTSQSYIEKPFIPFDSEISRSYSNTVYSKLRNISACNQIYGYYCGPATVKQLDDYYNGNNHSLSVWANLLRTVTQGTDFPRVQIILRDYVKSGYILGKIGSFDNWHRIVTNSLNNDRVAVLDIKTKSGVANFPYSTSGHILNVSGYRFGSVPNEVRVTDPHYDYSGNRWHPAHGLYNANFNHWRQEIIY